MPKVTVLMSVFNGEEFLHEAVNSILFQIFDDFEFLIIDDCSSDGSKDILRGCADRDRRVRLITNHKNIGLTKSLNIGIEKARGKYIARMDADDFSLPERLERQVQFMDENPDVTACGTWVKIIGSVEGEWKFPQVHESIKAQCLFNSCIVHPTAFLRTSFFQKNEVRYDDSFRHAQDYDLWERLVFNYNAKLANLPEILLHYRVHGKSVGRIASESQSEFAKEIRFRQFTRLTGKKAAEFEKLFNRVAKWEIVFDKVQLLDVERLFGLLISGNRKKTLYSQNALIKELSERFYRICRANTQLGLFSYKTFKNYSFFGDFSFKVPVKEKIKFIIRALLCK